MASTTTTQQITTGSTRSFSTRPLILGAVGGMVSGAIFGALNMWYAHSVGMGWNAPLKMIATLLQGESSMMNGKASPVLGLVIHMMLSAMFGILLALITTRLRSDGERAFAGLVFGALLYALNFLVLAHVAFHAFKSANQPVELATHLVFGAMTVLFLLNWRSQRDA